MSATTSELLNMINSKKSISDYLETAKSDILEVSLSEYLAELLQKSPLSKAQIIQRSGLERGYAYQIFNGEKEHPNRDKLIRLAFGMKLSVDETQQLLKVANQAVLYPRNKRDSIILFALLHDANVINCDELLEAQDEDILR
jgi:transcriptional regulator with XRE-family HTH domain